MEGTTPPDKDFLDFAAALLYAKIDYCPTHQLTGIVEDPEFAEYFPQLPTYHQQTIIARCLYNARGRWSTKSMRIGLNKLLTIAKPAPDKDGILEQYAQNGLVTLYRGTDKKEAAKFLSGTVEDLGNSLSLERIWAKRYACSHRTKGRVIAITIPAKYVKFFCSKMYGTKDAEVNISIPEVWPQITDLQVYKISLYDYIKDRRERRKAENEDLKNTLLLVKDLYKLRDKREQTAKDLDDQLAELAKNPFINPNTPLL